jgi:DNA-binding LacI/PurR family transcriptional regulator
MKATRMDMRRTVTIKDVADKVGVSKMTVSAVLNGKSNHVRVSEATRVRVLEAARELGYRPNAVARSLRRRYTNIIGLYSGYGFLNARGLFLAEIIGGLQEGCDCHRKDLLLHGVFRGHSVDDIYAELVDGRIDGLVLQSSPDDPLVEQLAASSLPVVAIADPLPTLPSVGVDNDTGSRLLVAYLVEEGHRHILYRSYRHPRDREFAGPAPLPRPVSAGADVPRQMTSVVRRKAVFFEAAAEQGLQVTDWSVPSATRAEEFAAALGCGAPHAERPTAVVCWNDIAAYELLAHCAQLGLRVPEDVAVLGFDGLPAPPNIAIRLTTIRAPWIDVAHRAIDLLVARMDGETIPMNTVLPVAFAAGDTG